MKRTIYIWLAALALTLAACSEYDMVDYQEQMSLETSNLSKEQKELIDVSNVLRTVLENPVAVGQEKFSLNDVKYGFARYKQSDEKTIYQIPLIHGRVSGKRYIDIFEVRDLIGEELKYVQPRYYIYVKMSDDGESAECKFVEDMPAVSFSNDDSKDLFYDKLVGDKILFDSNGRKEASINVDGNEFVIGKLGRTRSMSDTTVILDSVVVTPQDSSWMKDVTNGFYNNVYSNDSTEYGDSLTNDVLCPTCYSPMLYDDATLEYYCPYCSDKSGGGGGGNGTAGETEKQKKMRQNNNAALYATQRASSKSRGKCAQYVRIALEAAGFKIERPYREYKGPDIYDRNKKLIYKHGTRYSFACDYGNTLVKAGFTEITPTDDYEPEIGDVRVFPSPTQQNPAGHIDIWNGKNWVSDFVEPRKRPGVVYQEDYDNNNYKVYRNM